MCANSDRAVRVESVQYDGTGLGPVVMVRILWCWSASLGAVSDLLAEQETAKDEEGRGGEPGRFAWANPVGARSAASEDADQSGERLPRDDGSALRCC